MYDPENLNGNGYIPEPRPEPIGLKIAACVWLLCALGAVLWLFSLVPGLLLSAGLVAGLIAFICLTSWAWCTVFE